MGIAYRYTKMGLRYITSLGQSLLFCRKNRVFVIWLLESSFLFVLADREFAFYNCKLCCRNFLDHSEYAHAMSDLIVQNIMADK